MAVSGRRCVSDRPGVPRTGWRVAVVGPGPAGLACAAFLIIRGHDVHVFGCGSGKGCSFDRGHGSDRAGYVRSLGAGIGGIGRTGGIGGSDAEIASLRRDHDAVFIDAGWRGSIDPGLPGGDLEGIYSADDYLARIGLSLAFCLDEIVPPPVPGRRVAVLGCKKIAIDSALAAMGTGRPDAVNLVCVEAVGNGVELDEIEEKINFVEASPIRFASDRAGRLSGVAVLGGDGFFTIEADVAVVALDPGPTTPELPRDLEACDSFGRTSLERVWIGGSPAEDRASVVQSIDAGVRSAGDIDALLRGVSA